MIWSAQDLKNSYSTPMLATLDEKGKRAIAKPTAVSLNAIQQEQVLTPPKVWTVPTVAGNKLFVRDQKEIVKFDLN